MNPRQLLVPAALLAALAVIVPAALPRERGGGNKGAAPTKTAPPTTVGNVPAHLRLWKTDLVDAPTVRLTWGPAGEVSGKLSEVTHADAGYQFGSYVEVPAGLGVVATDAAGRPIASVPADLAPGSFHTLLVTPQGAELIADDPAADAGTADLTLRNLAPGARVVSLRVGEELTARFGTPGGLLRMRGLKAGIYTVHTEGTDAAGNSFDWTVEADFTHAPRQTLLVYPDPYGRIRPRLCVDGGLDADKGDKTDQR